MTIALKDVLIGGILVLGMTVIAYIPILLMDQRRRRFDRERYLEKSRISTAILFNTIRQMRAEHKEILKRIGGSGAGERTN